MTEISKPEGLRHAQLAEKKIRERKSSEALSEIGIVKTIISGLREPMVEVPPVEPPKGKVIFESPGLLSDMNLGGSGLSKQELDAIHVPGNKLYQGSGYIESRLPAGSNRAEYAYSLPDFKGVSLLDEFELFIASGSAWPLNNAGHNLFTQLKSEGEGSPEAALQAWIGRASGKKEVWSSFGGIGDSARGPLREDVWQKIAIKYENLAESSPGKVSLTVDGEVRIDRLTVPHLIVPGHSTDYIKHGLYRAGGELAVVRQRNFRLTQL